MLQKFIDRIVLTEPTERTIHTQNTDECIEGTHWTHWADMHYLPLILIFQLMLLWKKFIGTDFIAHPYMTTFVVCEHIF